MSNVRVEHGVVFFTDDVVVKAVDKGVRKALSKWGAFVRSDARNSMRKATKNVTASRPGEPPRVHSGELKRFLYFVWDPKKKSCVVGPMRLKKKGLAPNVLEYGGTVTLSGEQVVARIAKDAHISAKGKESRNKMRQANKAGSNPPKARKKTGAGSKPNRGKRYK